MMDILKCFQASFKSFTPAKPYLVGDSLTLADISSFFTLTLLDILEIDWSEIAQVREYFDAIDAELKKYDQDGYFKAARENLIAYAKIRLSSTEENL